MTENSQRVLTAVLLLAAVLSVVSFAPTALVATGFALVFIPATIEWSKLLERERRFAFLFYLLSCWLLVSLAAWYLSKDYSKTILYFIVLWWVLVLIITTFYEPRLCPKHSFRWFLRLHIIVALVGCWLALEQLHRADFAWLIYAVALVTVSDTAAYYGGRRFGKRKLSPAISSGKSLEGLLAALLATLLLSAATAFIFVDWFDSHLARVSFILLSLVACLAGVLGDLSESMAKRCAQVKDSGKLLAGHGGVLDRIDAFLAATPVIALGMTFI